MDEALNRITPECNDGLTEVQQYWLTLVNVLNRSDSGRIVSTSRKLLEQADSMPQDRHRFLVMAELLGLAMEDRPDEFKRDFDKYLPYLILPDGSLPFTAEILRDHMQAVGN